MPTPTTTLLDTNTLIDVQSRSSPRFVQSLQAVFDASVIGIIAINPIVLGEFAEGFDDRAELEQALPPVVIQLPLPARAGWLAGQALRQYRARGGSRTSPVADFYIGGHAQADGLRLLTRDVARFSTYFPDVELVVPDDR
ncbi:MAG: PIN domain-containing protein [Planctomycetota bacterium]